MESLHHRAILLPGGDVGLIRHDNQQEPCGLEPAAGTDVTGIYLDNINPFLAIYAAVTRDSDDGLFEPAQAVSVTEALKMWTVWAAKSMGESGVKGSIEAGKYADMTVLSDDIFTMQKEGLKDVKVLKTIVGGNVVYEAQ